MRLCSWCGFEGHGAEGTFKENLAVSALDVGLYRCDISEDHTAVDTAARRSSNLPSFSPVIETVFHCPFYSQCISDGRPLVAELHTDR